jgi:hypothetical protein
MSHTIELPPLLESRIEIEAAREGITPDEIILRLVQREFAASIDTEEQKRQNASSVSLLQSWIASAPITAEEQDEAEADLLEFKRNIDRTRAELGQGPAYPEAE